MRALAVSLLVLLLCSGAAAEDPPEIRYVLLISHWQEGSGGWCMGFDCTPSNERTWVLETHTFGYLEEVGEYLAGNYWYADREIVGLWGLDEAAKIPVSTWETTKTIPKEKVIEERKETTRHFKVGDEEYKRESGSTWTDLSVTIDDSNIIFYDN